MGIIEGLNKIFESRVRLGIMSILMVNDSVDYNTVKELLDITDGNLASHIKALEKAEYISIEKRFVGKKPKTTYSASKLGKSAFKSHLSALEKILKGKI